MAARRAWPMTPRRGAAARRGLADDAEAGSSLCHRRRGGELRGATGAAGSEVRWVRCGERGTAGCVLAEILGSRARRGGAGSEQRWCEEPAVSSGGEERAVLHLLLEKNSFGYLTFSLLATHTSKWVWYLGFHCWRQSYIQTCISAIKKMWCMLHTS